MPLLDHFRPPLSDQISWTSLHASWATRIADDLNERWLAREFVAFEFMTLRLHPEMDIATSQKSSPATSFVATFPEVFEVQIFSHECGRKLVSIIALVSPSNKDKLGDRRAFAAKTAAYLSQGVSVVIMDIVTSKRFNLHNDLVDLLAAPAGTTMPADQTIYTASYRPTFRNEKPQIDLWCESLAIGQPLPTMPLRLTGDLFVPVEFESTYVETCRRRRLI